jgi:hypothetical protein
MQQLGQYLTVPLSAAPSAKPSPWPRCFYQYRSAYFTAAELLYAVGCVAVIVSANLLAVPSARPETIGDGIRIEATLMPCASFVEEWHTP